MFERFDLKNKMDFVFFYLLSKEAFYEKEWFYID